MPRGRRSKPKIYNPPATGIQPAAWLGEVGRKYFAELIDRLAQVPGMLEHVDDHALSMLCAAYQDYHSAQDLIDKEGEVIKTHNGFRCQHPATKLKKDALARIAMGLDQFGLNPRSRKRMGTTRPDAKAPDAFKGFSGTG